MPLYTHSVQNEAGHGPKEVMLHDNSIIFWQIIVV